MPMLLTFCANYVMIGMVIIMTWLPIFNLSMILLVPSIMIVCGLLFLRKPPHNINGAFGYRTTMAKKNQDTWQFAHHYCGKILLWLGLILIVLSFVSFLLISDMDDETMSIITIGIQCLQLVPLLASIIPTEIALRKTFDKNGKRKQS